MSSSQVFLFALNSMATADIPAFDKMRRSVEKKGACFILFHSRRGMGVDGRVLCRPHYIVTPQSLSDLRYQVPTMDSLVPGNVHLPLIQFFRERVEQYFWYIEYDVRFTGNWEDFFSYYDLDDSDLLTSHLRFYAQEPGWRYWKTLMHPTEHVDLNRAVRGFNPVFRISREALGYIDRKQTDGWVGHHEVLLSTLLYQGGFKLRDFGGAGPFVRVEDKDRFYIDSSDENMLDGSVRYRPSHLFLFCFSKDKLFHPVKTGVLNVLRVVFYYLMRFLQDLFIGQRKEI